MEATRHQWDKPELTVLVRNRPEEAVLAACKYSGRTSPGSNRTGCRRHVTGNTCAGSQCDLIAPS